MIDWWCHEDDYGADNDHHYGDNDGSDDDDVCSNSDDGVDRGDDNGDHDVDDNAGGVCDFVCTMMVIIMVVYSHQISVMMVMTHKAFHIYILVIILGILIKSNLVGHYERDLYLILGESWHCWVY